MPSTYPGIEALIKPVRIRSAWRIFPLAHKKTPLGAGPGDSRFAAPNDEFLVLYAAPQFKVSLRETVIRDDFDGVADRTLPRSLIEDRACAQLSSTGKLRLLNLTAGRAHDFGVASAVRHGTDYAQSQSFSKTIFDETTADGILYRSRFDEAGYCVAVYDRAFDPKSGKKMRSQPAFPLEQHPELEDALLAMRINLTVI